MNQKAKYAILTVALLTVLAAILVSLGGRLAPNGGSQETAEPVQTSTPTPEPIPPSAPEPPAAPEGTGAPVTPPSAPVPESTPAPESHAIVVTAGPGGTVEPRGLVSVSDGGSVSFTFTPDEGFEVAEVKVDGQAVSSPAGYVFSSVHESHALYVIFREISGEPEAAPEPAPETPEPEATPEADTGPEGDVTHGFFA